MANEKKTWSSKSNVRRGMKPQVEGVDYEIVAEGGGQFSVRSLKAQPEQPKQVEAPVTAAKQVEGSEKATPKPAADVHGKSTAETPTKLVHAIAEMMHKENPKVRRKDVIAECVKQGIAFYTARTQYQQWYQAQKA